MTDVIRFYFKLLRASALIGLLFLHWTLLPTAVLRAEETSAPTDSACDTKKGMSWDTRTGRCVINTSTIKKGENINSYASKCDTLTDAVAKKACQDKFATIALTCEKKTSDADKKKCYEGASTEDINATETELDAYRDQDTKILSLFRDGALGLNVGFLTVALLTSKPIPGCASRLIFAATSAASLVLELFLYFKSESSLKDLANTFDTKALQLDSQNAQRESLDYMVKSQNIVIDILTAKTIGYSIATAGYGVAALVAAAEMIWQANACTPSAKEATTFRIPTKNYFLEFFLKQILSNANALDKIDQKDSAAGDLKKEYERLITFGATALGGAGMAALMQSSTKKLVQSSLGVFILSFISGMFTGFLAGFSSNDLEITKNNKTIVENLLNEFDTATTGTCTMTDREELSKPQCYCYNADGTKNQGRTKSETCINMWSGDKPVEAIKPEDIKLAGQEKPMGCVTKTGQFDADCRCRNFKDQKGKNLCQTVSMPSAQFGNLGSNLDMKSAVDNLNSVLNGNFSQGKYDGSKITQQAAAANKLRKQLIEKVDALQKKKGQPTVSSQIEQFANTVAKAVTPELIKKMPNTAITPPNPIDQIPKNMDKKLAEKLEKQLSLTAQGGLGKKNEVQESKGQPFSFGTESASGNQAKSFEFDGSNNGKNFNYGDNDIVKKEDVPIWQIITNRYNSSGLRRLFEETP